RHVQQRSAGHGEEPALESGPEERRAGGRVGQVAVSAGEAVIHIHPTAFIAPGAVVLGDVTLAARASVWYGAVLRGDMDAIVIGRGSVLLNGAHIAAGSVVAAGAVVPEGMRVAPGSLVVGVPARVTRAVDDALRERIRQTWEHYVTQAERHRAGRFPAARPSL